MATEKVSPDLTGHHATVTDETARKGSVFEAQNVEGIVEGVVVNASGHQDQMKRHFNIWSLIGLALTVDNAWVALGGSLGISVANGGGPGILYELIIATFYYTFIGASISELASSMPTSGGVYHWASVIPGPKIGRWLGFFTGFINFFGWMFDLASICQIESNVAVQLYAVTHPGHEILPWQVYVAYILITIACVIFCIFCNGLIPKLQDFGLFLIVGGGLITVITVAAMPEQHASTSSVFVDWSNMTGWSSGVAFMTGVLNGAFTIGTTDSITHIAEELPDPKRDIPKAILTQIGLGFLTAFCFAIAILYGINDFNAIIYSNGSFPLAEAYLQATNRNQSATIGLLVIIFLSLLICLIGTFLTLSRIWWALARDNAVPFSKFFSKVNTKLSCPIESMIFIMGLCLALGAIPLGSKTAFLDLAGSFIILTTTSYAIPIAAHILGGRKAIKPGPFWMGKAGFIVQGLALAFITLFNVFFCFPAALPTTVQLMNYNSVILVGVFALTTFWWFIYGLRNYPGPKIYLLHRDD